MIRRLALLGLGIGAGLAAVATALVAAAMLAASEPPELGDEHRALLDADPLGDVDRFIADFWRKSSAEIRAELEAEAAGRPGVDPWA